ncbi:MAG TPA: nucleotidyltransferase family protein [Fimbriiglobus sp.]|nr:nucleotidyltransferase family protein [Fimbriiglobus sp.]
MIVAVVPACGHSTRMGRPKLSLPLGDGTVLGHLVAALREGGADRVVVVVGPHVRELTPIAEAAGADVLSLAEPTADMRATVEHGLKWIAANVGPQPDGWLLAPADHPAVTVDVVRRLCESFRAQGARPVVVPVHDGKRGHPTLVPWRLAGEVPRIPAGQGINALLRTAETVEVPAASAGVLADLDTPDDYERLRATWPG